MFTRCEGCLPCAQLDCATNLQARVHWHHCTRRPYSSGTDPCNVRGQLWREHCMFCAQYQKRRLQISPCDFKYRKELTWISTQIPLRCACSDDDDPLQLGSLSPSSSDALPVAVKSPSFTFYRISSRPRLFASISIALLRHVYGGKIS
jgi:hypothetical protein